MDAWNDIEQSPVYDGFYGKPLDFGTYIAVPCVSYSMPKLLLYAFLLMTGTLLHAQEMERTIKSIYFGGGSYYVDEEQLEELYQFMDSIPNIFQYHITIHSHTDNIGGAAYNEWLSEMRSRAAIEKLLFLDFKSNQIEIKDFGQFNPIYDNDTWIGRMKNRRVDIIFWPMVM